MYFGLFWQIISLISLKLKLIMYWNYTKSLNMFTDKKRLYTHTKKSSLTINIILFIFQLRHDNMSFEIKAEDVRSPIPLESEADVQTVCTRTPAHTPAHTHTQS